MNEKSNHPYGPYIPEGAKKLIIGTMPPYRFCHRDSEQLFPEDVDFYYGSKSNYFWPILSDIFNIELHYTNSREAVEERKELLKQIKTGITDIVDICVHSGGRADDLSLLDIRQKDITALLAEHPTIGELVYTSRFVVRQVNLSVERFCSIRTHHTWNRSDPLDGAVKINGRTYAVRVLYSPSPNALRSVTSQARRERYLAVLGPQRD